MKEKIKKRILVVLSLIVAISVFILIHKHLNAGIFYDLFATLILFTIIGGCWQAWNENRDELIRTAFWSLITLVIVIALAKSVYPAWFSISVYGIVMVSWGYFLGHRKAFE